MGKNKKSDKVVPVLKHHNTERTWKRGTAAHIFNFSIKYKVSGQSHVSLRKVPTVSFKQ